MDALGAGCTCELSHLVEVLQHDRFCRGFLTSNSELFQVRYVLRFLEVWLAAIKCIPVDRDLQQSDL